MFTNGPSAYPPQHLQNAPEITAQLLHEEKESTRLALQVKKLSNKATCPTRGSEGSAGWDLYCAETTTIPAWSRALLPTHVAIAVPPSTYGRVAPRSGLSLKHGLTTGAGVIDVDYRGEVKVLLFNLSGEECVVKEGDRCAQLVLERCLSGGGVVVVEELGGSARGAGGFGSTGK